MFFARFCPNPLSGYSANPASMIAHGEPENRHAQPRVSAQAIDRPGAGLFAKVRDWGSGEPGGRSRKPRRSFGKHGKAPATRSPALPGYPAPSDIRGAPGCDLASSASTASRSRGMPSSRKRARAAEVAVGRRKRLPHLAVARYRLSGAHQYPGRTWIRRASGEFT
jgi:hypothetical protein